MDLDPSGIINTIYEKRVPLTAEEHAAIRSGSKTLYWIGRYAKHKRITDGLYEAKFRPDGETIPRICDTGNRQT
jgi:hypothetical protein